MSYWQEIVGDTFNWRALYLSSWRSKTLTCSAKTHTGLGYMSSESSLFAARSVRHSSSIKQLTIGRRCDDNDMVTTSIRLRFNYRSTAL